MEAWFKISLLLSVFGFMKEIRPSEPYFYAYLVGPWNNYTDDDVNQIVYPMGIYSYLALLIVVFLITDLCRYKPLIIILGLAGVVVWGLLIWTHSLDWQRVVQVFFGTFMATEVAYYTYIYAKVDKEYFQKVTSHTRAAILAGKTISGISAQLLVSFDVLDYMELNYVSFAMMLAATSWSIFLPPVRRSIYFHRSPEIREDKTKKYKRAFNLMKSHFTESFSNRYVIKWSIWWALATCGYIQSQTYSQPLWSAIQEDTSYNGVVEAVSTLIGFSGALAAGYIKTDWRQRGEILLAVCTSVAGGLLLFNSQATSIVACYICYVLFGGIYYFVITIASSEIAKNIQEDSYGLVFGLNTFVALLLQSLLATIVVTEVGFAVEIRGQFLIYGSYHIFIASIYIIFALVSYFRQPKERVIDVKE